MEYRIHMVSLFVKNMILSILDFKVLVDSQKYELLFFVPEDLLVEFRLIVHNVEWNKGVIKELVASSILPILKLKAH